ncbi:MAG: ABC transporter ATP-binding protein [Eubacteriales bacterium]|nr:ABC transporter ATP-binding protein [Eubacteriales bacterium]
MLTVTNLNVFYDAIHAIHDVSFHVDEGEIVTLIGANGAGKTTIMQTVSGLLKAKSGEIAFFGQDLRTIEPHRIVELGLAQVPERRRVFTQLSVQENLEMGAFTRKDKNNLAQDYEAIFQRFPRLYERRKQLAGTLSGGEQQMLAIGRALMSKPKLLLMDEPSMGLSPILVQEIFKIIRDVRDTGTTVLLVEQNAQEALKIADRAYVLETGTVAAQGPAAELLGNDEVRRAYLGI